MDQKLDAALPDVLRPPISAGVGLLLESRIPARMAWVARDGSPRVVPTWFSWTGSELVMTTASTSQKLGAISDGTILAVTIDTDDFPYRSLKLRGPVSVRTAAGLSDEYRLQTMRYLGAELGERWLEFLGDRDRVVISMRPTWAVTADMSDIAFLAD